jgi:hypothetical protein
MEEKMRALIVAGMVLMVASIGCKGHDESGKAGLSKGGLMPQLSAGSTAHDGVKSAAAFTAANLLPDPSGLSRIEVGRPVQGRLSSSDPLFSDGTFYDAWIFETPGVQDVLIEMSSESFDAYLGLAARGPGGRVMMLASADDSGDNPNPSLRYRLVPGVYIIFANSSHPGETGEYRLSVRSMTSSPPSGPDRVLESGVETAGSLDSGDTSFPDGSYFENWTYFGRAGDRLTVTMSSDDFDAYLVVGIGAPGTFELLDEDDDGAGGLNSNITVFLPETGPYTILANSVSAGATGSYSILAETTTPTASDWEVRFPGGGDPRGQYALLVGISNYPGVDSDLRGPVEDVDLMRDVLIDRYGFPEYNIVVLTDEEASRAGIANAFVRHLGQAGPEGVAVFFFSGHGIQMDQNLGLTAPLDPEDDDEALYVWGVSEGSSLLLDDELGYLVDQLPAERILLLVDACFSGTISRGPIQTKEVFPDEVGEFLRVPRGFITAQVDQQLEPIIVAGEEVHDVFNRPLRHMLFSSSSEDQPSATVSDWPDREEPAGLFTRHLADILRRSSSGATFASVQRDLNEAVRSFVSRGQGRRFQEAQLLGINTSRTIEEFLSRR